MVSSSITKAAKKMRGCRRRTRRGGRRVVKVSQTGRRGRRTRKTFKKKGFARRRTGGDDDIIFFAFYQLPNGNVRHKYAVFNKNTKNLEYYDLNNNLEGHNKVNTIKVNTIKDDETSNTVTIYGSGSGVVEESPHVIIIERDTISVNKGDTYMNNEERTQLIQQIIGDIIFYATKQPRSHKSMLESMFGNRNRFRKFKFNKPNKKLEYFMIGQIHQKGQIHQVKNISFDKENNTVQFNGVDNTGKEEDPIVIKRETILGDDYMDEHDRVKLIQQISQAIFTPPPPTPPTPVGRPRRPPPTARAAPR